jgi:hypothetical protein
MDKNQNATNATEEKPDTLKLIRMSDVATEQVKWLWYPYIPFGKITMIQGDPGDGKTTAVLAIAAALTTGVPLPENKEVNPPMSVIFQTAEDGLGDTIKPRLEHANADCSRVIVIDETDKALSLLDERIKRITAIVAFAIPLINAIASPITLFVKAQKFIKDKVEKRWIRAAFFVPRAGSAIYLFSAIQKRQL